MNLVSNMDKSMNSCIILKEGKGIQDGIAQGDFSSVAVNMGLISLYALPLSGS